MIFNNPISTKQSGQEDNNYIILILSQPFFARKGCVFNAEAANTNSIVFGLTHPVMSITITQPTQTFLTALK
jgi:hypothetical protein